MELPRPDIDSSWDPEQDDLVFQVLDWYVPEDDRIPKIKAYKDRYGVHYPKEAPEYSAFVFGVTAFGNSVCLKITNFHPSFYVQLPKEKWEGKTRGEVMEAVKAYKDNLLNGRYVSDFQGQQTTRTILPYKLKSHLEYVKLVYRKDFWGFNNGETFPFIKIKVKSLSLFNTLKWYHMRELVPKGYKLYESNISPLLRLIHEQKLDPCGWIRVNAGTYQTEDADGEGCGTGDDDEDENTDGIPMSRCQINASANVKDIHCEKRNAIAPLLVASFDIECTSSHGDFPVARKGYMKLALDLIQYVKIQGCPSQETLSEMIQTAFVRSMDYNGNTIHCVYPKKECSAAEIRKRVDSILNAGLYDYLKNINSDEDSDNEDEKETPKGEEEVSVERDVCRWLEGRRGGEALPPLSGDPLIQIGTTVHRYGSDEILFKHIITLKSCKPIEGAVVESYDTEEEVLMAWKDLMARLDPDILMGYNIFGFDMEYIWNRALELGCIDDFSMGFGRLQMRRAWLDEQKLASSALGSNFLKFISIEGIVLLDMYKVIQRDQKLDSYKLDSVAQIFLGDQKNDLKPQEIFQKYKGNAADRAEIARYCIQDCALVNRLLHKLKVLENNIGMGNVCSVPLSYLFMRGQGVKIFSLVAKFCRSLGMVIPVVKGFQESSLDEDGEGVGYEGAIVLPPKIGIYLEDPITVFDFSSLYPSSMIERDLSHDRIVLQPEKYGNLQEKGIEYITVSYDEYAGVGDKKRVVGQKQVVFAKMPNDEKGVIPTILMELLKQRKNTRKKMEYETLTLSDGRRLTGLVQESGEDSVSVLDVEKGTSERISQNLVINRMETYNEFEGAVLDALQLAYKITANSLYGQIGSRTSPIYLKEIAACTTATGRERIMLAKGFMEKEYGADIIYGDTDSIFCKFPCYDDAGVRVKGRDALPLAIRAGQVGAKAIKAYLPKPQSLEYEKTFFPFILLSKKRYVGNLYENDAFKKPKQKSMGIALKRRDYAKQVKIMYGGVIGCFLDKSSLPESERFLKEALAEMVDGRVPLENLIITKTLAANYKDPKKIAHRVLADRMALRDPGNKPQVNDRLPFVYIVPPEGTEVKLQGDRIETPDYIREAKLTPDYRFYITNQIMKPICQIYALCVEQLEGYPYRDCGYDYWALVEEKLREKAIYKEDERKRQDKLMDLRMDMAGTILFEPFLEKLPNPTVKKQRGKVGQSRSDALIEASQKAATKAAAVASRAKAVASCPCLRLVFSSKEIKADNTKKNEPKTLLEGTIEAFELPSALNRPVELEGKESLPNATAIWKHTIQKGKMTSKKMDTTVAVNKTVFYAQMFEFGFRHFLEQEAWKTRMNEEGVEIRIDYDPVRVSLNKAIKSAKETPCLYDQMDSVAETMDIGRLKEFNDINQYRYVANYLEKVPHKIVKDLK
jgi:DNA polymerase delta subunit 1